MTKGANKLSINFGVFNARSMCNKTTGVLETLIHNKIDVCFVTETWIQKNDSTKFAEIHERGFELLNAPRKGIGGGVGFIFNVNTIKLVRNNVQKYPSFEALEAVLKTSTDTLRLCVIYRSTSQSSNKIS